MGAAVTARVSERSPTPDHPDRIIEVLNEYLFEDQGFNGNRDDGDDPRNSFLSDVLDRRTGLPITLAVVYMEVARLAGIRIDGVNFPGHFLLRVPIGPRDTDEGIIVDPFHRGAVLSETDCRDLLRRHAGNDAVFDRRLLAPTSKQQIIIRMLVNLKQTYVRMRSFNLARRVTDVLLAIDPSSLTELRDRGLLAYHLDDFSAALRDLESYLRFAAQPEDASASEKDERSEIWEHVKVLRRRLASLN